MILFLLITQIKYFKKLRSEN